MKIEKRLDSWSERFRSGFTDGLRIFLGLILFVKGFQLLFDMAGMVQTIEYNFGFSSLLIVQILAGIHLYFGFFLIIGLATRFACLVQIPIVSAAIFFVNANFARAGMGELVLSIITLLLLIYFLLEGNGKFSVYNFWMNSKRSRLTDATEEEFEQKPKSPFIDFFVPNE